MTRAAEKNGATVKDKKHDQEDAVEAKTKTQDHGKAANAKKHDDDQDQAAEAKTKSQNQGKAADAKDQTNSKSADAKDQRHEANGQGSVGQGGTDKQGRPLTKDGHVDHRIKSEK